jgi:predicted nucleotidyltransferase
VPAIDLTPEHERTLRAILDAYVPEFDVRAFGSRVRFSAHPFSDLDLALMTDRPLAPERLADLRAALAESALPFPVDVVDHAAVSGVFRRIVMDEGVEFRRALGPGVPPAAWRRHEIAQWIERGQLVIGEGYRSRREERTSEGLPLARLAHLRRAFDLSGAEHLRAEAAPALRRWIARPGDVVFVPASPPRGVALVPACIGPFVYAQEMCFWRVAGDVEIDPRFLVHWMRSRAFRGQCAALAVPSSAGGRVSLAAQRRMFIHLPPRPEQQAIAAALDQLELGLELNGRQHALLSRAACLSRRRASPALAPIDRTNLLQRLRATRAIGRDLRARYDAVAPRLLSGECRPGAAAGT